MKINIFVFVMSKKNQFLAPVCQTLSAFPSCQRFWIESDVLSTQERIRCHIFQSKQQNSAASFVYYIDHVYHSICNIIGIS